MRRPLLFALALSFAAPGLALAKPGGCLKYGAAGAVGGHMVHHGVLGAAGGCAAGMYRRHEYNKQQRALARQQHEQHDMYGTTYR